MFNKAFGGRGRSRTRSSQNSKSNTAANKVERDNATAPATTTTKVATTKKILLASPNNQRTITTTVPTPSYSPENMNNHEVQPSSGATKNKTTTTFTPPTSLRARILAKISPKYTTNVNVKPPELRYEFDDSIGNEFLYCGEAANNGCNLPQLQSNEFNVDALI